MSILKPGMRCLIIGEDRGCEANIGATLTITEQDPYPEPGEPLAWLFKDASRPLLMLDHNKCVLHEPVLHSFANSVDESYFIMIDRYLIPIPRDPDQPDEEILPQPEEVTQ